MEERKFFDILANLGKKMCLILPILVLLDYFSTYFAVIRWEIAVETNQRAVEMWDKFGFSNSILYGLIMITLLSLISFFIFKFSTEHRRNRVGILITFCVMAFAVVTWVIVDFNNLYVLIVTLLSNL